VVTFYLFDKAASCSVKCCLD